MSIQENSTFGLNFDEVTEKQMDVLRLLADGRTGKEIAAALEVSESAVVKRIELLRRRAGGATRAEVVRRFKAWQSQSTNQHQDETCKNVAGLFFHLENQSKQLDQFVRDENGSDFELADASMPFSAFAPWQDQTEPKVVPEVLDGENAVLFRWVATVGITVGLVVSILTILAIASLVPSLL